MMSLSTHARLKKVAQEFCQTSLEISVNSAFSQRVVHPEPDVLLGLNRKLEWTQERIDQLDVCVRKEQIRQKKTYAHASKDSLEDSITNLEKQLFGEISYLNMMDMIFKSLQLADISKKASFGRLLGEGDGQWLESLGLRERDCRYVQELLHHVTAVSADILAEQEALHTVEENMMKLERDLLELTGKRKKSINSIMQKKMEKQQHEEITQGRRIHDFHSSSLCWGFVSAF
ncbi:uncharacterized protein LOC143247015 isoform X2 [Tachypleus tridentatus]|uniref:uncharacterized protein LOC143247015 isoform X2 n=1 Tax=Tachypleus tridentatus TaxID=6853 RepID=UPI003FD1FA76